MTRTKMQTTMGWVGAVAVVFSLVQPLQALAKATDVHFKDTPLDLTGVSRVAVSGLKGSVRLLAQSGTGKAGVLKVHKVLPDKAPSEVAEKFETLTVNVRRDGEVLIIEAGGPTVKSGIEAYWGAMAPEVFFDFEIPAVAIEATFHDGQISAQGWKAPITAQLVEGSVKLSGGEGAVRLAAQKGEFKIDNHRGRLNLDGYNVKIVAQNVDGDVELMNFAGDSSLSQVRGNLDVRSVSGGVAVAKSSGALDFSVVRAGLSATDFEGAVRGSSDDGAVNLQLVGEADVTIQSNQGAVTVKLPTGSGASLKLRSDEGVITAPEPVQVAKSGDERHANGRLSGSGAKGTVMVTSKTGAIRVR